MTIETFKKAWVKLPDNVKLHNWKKLKCELNEWLDKQPTPEHKKQAIAVYEWLKEQME